MWLDGRLQLAHREVCRAAFGPPPTQSHVAAHSCGNGHLGCVNPKHVRWATDEENKHDMLAHGTRLFGEANGAARLTAQQVRAIRDLCASLSQRKIASMFGVSKSTVSSICHDETWVGV